MGDGRGDGKGDVPNKGDGATAGHEGDFVDDLDSVSISTRQKGEWGRGHTVVMVSTPHAECSQSIQTASKPKGAMKRAIGIELRPK